MEQRYFVYKPVKSKKIVAKVGRDESMIDVCIDLEELFGICIGSMYETYDIAELDDYDFIDYEAAREAEKGITAAEYVVTKTIHSYINQEHAKAIARYAAIRNCFPEQAFEIIPTDKYSLDQDEDYDYEHFEFIKEN